MVAGVIVQGANIGFLIGIIFITYDLFKAFHHRTKSNSALLDRTSYGLSIFSSRDFTAEGNRYRKRFLLATLATVCMLLLPWVVRCFE